MHLLPYTEPATAEGHGDLPRRRELACQISNGEMDVFFIVVYSKDIGFVPFLITGSKDNPDI